MARDVNQSDELSALGTVMQQVVQRNRMTSRMSHKERQLLNACLQSGLESPDFYAVRKICEMADRFFTPGLLSLLLCERMASNEGSTYLSLEPELLTPRLMQLGIDERDARAIIAKAPSWLEAAPALFAASVEDYKPFVLKNKRLYRHRFLKAERQINRIVARLVEVSWLDWSSLDSVFEKVTRHEPLGTRPHGDPMRRPISLAFEQQLAALVAVCAPLTVISGGPGTGKTSIVVTILRMLAALGVPMESIALTAPTGRAANRMDEALRKGLATLGNEDAQKLLEKLPEPKTLHRLLDFRPRERRFRFNKDNTLEYEWLIVDEGSMIDLVISESLLEAMNERTRLIILGDAHQLPSVEAGAVFRDLSRCPDLVPSEHPIEALGELRQRSPGIRAIHLTRSFRQKSDRGGQHVLHLSKLVNSGKTDQLFEKGEHPIQIHQKGRPLPWEGVCLVDPAEMNINTLIGHIYTKFVEPCRTIAAELTQTLKGNTLDVEDHSRLEPLFEASEKMRILCLTHKTMFGVEKLNGMLHDRFTRDRNYKIAGLPYMITQNDHRRGLYNGDIGLIIETGNEDNPHRFLTFRNSEGFRSEPFDSISGLQEAFAMTVHKSQGSETDHVVLVLPEQINALCKREVIYTGLTRAKKSVLIYGSRDVLETAVKDAMERVTGLFS